MTIPLKGQRSSGLTLIELIVTIVILSVAAGLALVSFKKTHSISVERDAVTQLKALHKAAHIYRIQNGGFLIGANLDASDIKDNFGMVMSEADMDFKYTSDGTDFTVRAEESSSCGGMCIQASSDDLSSSNPCCVQNCPGNTISVCP